MLQREKCCFLHVGSLGTAEECGGGGWGKMNFNALARNRHPKMEGVKKKSPYQYLSLKHCIVMRSNLKKSHNFKVLIIEIPSKVLFQLNLSVTTTIFLFNNFLRSTKKNEKSVYLLFCLFFYCNHIFKPDSVWLIYFYFFNFPYTHMIIKIFHFFLA